MKITVSNWLMSLLNMYNYPVIMFNRMCWPGGYSNATLRVYLYSLKYDNINNTENVIYIFDPSTCNLGSNVSPCSIARFDNPGAGLGISGTPMDSYWCKYSVYEVISLIGAN